MATSDVSTKLKVLTDINTKWRTDGLKWALASSAMDVTVCSDLLESMRTAHLNVETAKTAVAACQKLLQETTTTRTFKIEKLKCSKLCTILIIVVIIVKIIFICSFLF